MRVTPSSEMMFPSDGKGLNEVSAEELVIVERGGGAGSSVLAAEFLRESAPEKPIAVQF